MTYYRVALSRIVYLCEIDVKAKNEQEAKLKAFSKFHKYDTKDYDKCEIDVISPQDYDPILRT